MSFHHTAVVRVKSYLYRVVFMSMQLCVTWQCMPVCP